jgi:hypothetical protein
MVTTIILPALVGILTTALLYPLLKQHLAYVSMGRLPAMDRIKAIGVALLMFVLIFGQIFIVLFMVADAGPDARLNAVLITIAPTYPFFAYYFLRYTFPAAWRAEKRR